ncbi:MAG: LacI family DNA-binding transcriptional regulator, partial [Chloroflexota bacterium]
MRQLVLDAVNQLRALEEVQAVQAAAVSSSAAAASNDNDKEPLAVVVLHPSILRSSQVFSEFLQGIQAGATAYQIQLRLAVNETNPPDQHITRLYFSDPTLRPAGVLMIGARQHEPRLDEARQLGLPCVLVGRQSTDSATAAVGRDEEAIAFEAVSYLLNLGHRAIAFVGGDEAYSYTHSRIRGYRRALQEGGINTPDRWVSLGEGRAAAEKILTASPEITAALFINDAYAMDGLPLFQAAGRAIPADLSVISFDDTAVARTFDPPLTSVAYPRFQEGLWAVKVLVEQIRQPLVKSFQVVFRASLIQRASCAPPKPAG